MRHLVLAWALLLCVVSSSASAQERSESEAEADGYPIDDDPRRAEADPFVAAPASLWLSVVGAIGLEQEAVHGAGMIVLGGTLDDVVKGRELRVASAQAKTAPQDADRRGDPPQAPAEPDHADLRALAPLPHRGRLARGVVRAALAASSTSKAMERIDDAASRARWSGLVPELRLRVAQVVDEDQALAPTEYDPERITASGGTSLWMEGRATFRLDRLVFADDEVALERLRTDRAKMDHELIEIVLRSFATWQRAGGLLASEEQDDAARLSLEVELAVEEARLDALTDGWFGRALAEDRAKGAADAPQM